MTTEVATRRGIAERARPLNEVMLALLDAARDESLAEELCLQLDIFCCTLHAATTDVLSWTVPDPEAHYLHAGHPTMWRPPAINYLELDHKLGDMDHIKWLMRLADKLDSMAHNHARIPALVMERTVDLSHAWRNAAGDPGYGAEGRVSIRFYDSFSSKFTERQHDLLALMVNVSPEMYSKTLQVLESGIQPKTDVEKSLKTMCEYLARFYQQALNGGPWQGNPFARSHNSDAVRIGNQGMERFHV